MNLRGRAVVDMKRLNLAHWSGNIELIDPDGKEYLYDYETGATLKAVQILYGYTRVNPLTGEDMIVNEPVVSVALSSLERVPAAGERWFIKLPESPTSETLSSFVLTETRAPEGGSSVGFIRLYPTKAVQS